MAPARGSGTTITFTPDSDIFGEKLRFDAELIRERLETKSYLHRGMVVRFRDETVSPAAEATFLHEGGIAEYLPKLIAERGKALVPPTGGQFYLSRENGVRLELALCWTEATDEHVLSFVNGIPTANGGTHEAGLRSGHGEGRPQLHRNPQPHAQGGQSHRGGHSRGHGRAVCPPTSWSRNSRGKPRDG